MPPSTTISVPVIKRASSEARNSTACAVSRPSPMKPSGIRATRDLSRASTSPPVRCLASRASTIGVCIWPGTTVFTRTPFLAYCTAVTARKLDHGSLGRGVADLRRAGIAGTGSGRSIDDGTAALRDHHRDDVAAGQKHAFKIIIDLPIEILLRHFGDAAGRRATDIVDQDIDAAECLAARLDHGGDLGVLEHVADVGGDLAVIADARHRLGHRVRVLVDGEDFGTLAREQNRGGTAIAPARSDAPCPDNQRNLAVDPSRHLYVPLCESADGRA